MKKCTLKVQNDKRSEVGRPNKADRLGKDKGKNPASNTNCTKIHQHFSHIAKPPTHRSQCWSLKQLQKSTTTKFRIYLMLRIKTIPHFLMLFYQIHTFGIKLQITVETCMLSKCKLNSLNSLEYYVVPQSQKKASECESKYQGINIHCF